MDSWDLYFKRLFVGKGGGFQHLLINHNEVIALWIIALIMFKVSPWYILYSIWWQGDCWFLSLFDVYYLFLCTNYVRYTMYEK